MVVISVNLVMLGLFGVLSVKFFIEFDGEGCLEVVLVVWLYCLWWCMMLKCYGRVFCFSLKKFEFEILLRVWLLEIFISSLWLVMMMRLLYFWVKYCVCLRVYIIVRVFFSIVVYCFFLEEKNYEFARVIFYLFW